MPYSQLPNIFAKRDRDDKLFTTKAKFVNLLLELEHKYRTMRSTKKAPEDKIISKIDVHKFMDQVNDKCLMLMMKRTGKNRFFFGKPGPNLNRLNLRSLNLNQTRTFNISNL